MRGLRPDRRALPRSRGPTSASSPTSGPSISSWSGRSRASTRAKSELVDALPRGRHRRSCRCRLPGRAGRHRGHSARGSAEVESRRTHVRTIVGECRASTSRRRHQAANAAARPRRARRARPAARPTTGGGRLLALARRGAPARRRGPAHQRRLQREPDLDAGGAGAPARHGRRPSPGSGARRHGRARPRRAAFHEEIGARGRAPGVTALVGGRRARPRLPRRRDGSRHRWAPTPRRRGCAARQPSARATASSSRHRARSGSSA